MYKSVKILCLSALFMLSVSLNVWADKPYSFVEVTGTGAVKANRDLVQIQARIITKNVKSAAEALQENNKIFEAFKKELQSAKLDIKFLTTPSFEVRPVYTFETINTDHVTHTEQKFQHFEVIKSLNYKTVNIAQVGMIIDSMVKVGITHVDNVVFEVQNQDALMQKARTLAVQDAHDKAKLYVDTLASRSDIILGRVFQISESQAGHDRGVPMMMKMAAVEDATSLTPDEQVISVTVSTKWKILPNKKNIPKVVTPSGNKDAEGQ